MGGKKPVISHDDDFQFMEFSLALGSVTYQVVVFSKLNTLLPFVELGFFFFFWYVFKFLPNQHLYSEIKRVLSEAIGVIQHIFMKKSHICNSFIA